VQTKPYQIREVIAAHVLKLWPLVLRAGLCCIARCCRLVLVLLQDADADVRWEMAAAVSKLLTGKHLGFGGGGGGGGGSMVGVWRGLAKRGGRVGLCGGGKGAKDASTPTASPAQHNIHLFSSCLTPLPMMIALFLQYPT
jgi:hypothetical protein